jgi:WD40 repeat protein
MPSSSEPILESARRRRRKLRSSLPGCVADHRMLRPVAAGSYGEVWLAQNTLTGTYRAVKIIWRDAFETARPYEREFDAIRHFEPISRTHPGFVHILQTGRLPNGFYYIMELADDIHSASPLDVPKYEPTTLAVLKKNLSVDAAIRIGVSLTQSLEVLHRAGLIHRDIKPSNVIFIRGEPKLADVGLVAEASEAKSIVGTNGFIAPEGPTSPRADIFSLGKLLYEIATGMDRLEFPQLPKRTTGADNLLLEFNDIILKACDPDPSKRHPSVQAVRDELEFLLQGRSVHRVRQLEKALRWTKAWLATACAILVTGYFFLQSREAKRSAASQILERRIATAIALGNERLKEEDYLAALSDFGQAALLDSRNSKEHRLRVGSALAYAPKVAHIFRSDSDVACYSARSNILASVVQGQVRLTDLATTNVIREFNRGATDLAMSDDGRTLAIAGDNSMSVIDLASSLEEHFVLSAPILNVSLINNGTFAVTTKAGSAYLFPGGHRIPSDTNHIYRAVLSPSGHLLCVLRNDGTFTLLNTDDFVERFHGKHEMPQAYHATFFQDERTLVTSAYDRAALAWDIETGQRIGFPMEHEGGVVWSAISPDEKRIATGSLDRTVKVWNSPKIGGSRQNHILYHSEVIVWVRFISDKQILAHCGDGSTWLWSIDWEPQFRVQEPYTFRVPDRNVFFGQNTQLQTSSNVVAGSLGGVPFSVTLPAAVTAVTVDPAEQIVAIGTTDNTQLPQAVRLFSRSGEPLGKPLFHKDGIIYLTFSHSGRVLLSCGEDFAARLWTLRGDMVGPLRHKNQVRWACFSDNDEWVATASWDETIRIWNAASGLPVSAPLKVGNLVDYITFRGENELFIANSRRNYLVHLPSFDGDIAALLRSSPAPIEGDIF